MRRTVLLAAAAASVLAAAAQAQAPKRPAPAPAPAARAPAAPVQVVTGPVSTYWVSAETTSGFGAGLMGGAAGGGRPSLGSIMGAMRGAGQANHRLTLQLGSSKTAPAPAADHGPPPVLGLGPDLPLLTPKPVTVQREPEAPAQDQVPKEYQRPKGRMLIFWGCGEHARSGQPLVLDFGQMSEGKIPPGMATAFQGLKYTVMQPPSPTRNATYGVWPNEQTKQPPGPTASIVGPHTVMGNYTSPISFNLNPFQDFMPTLGLQAAKTPTGSALLTWTPAPAANAYGAMAIGAGQQDTVAIWMSSDAQAAAFVLPDYLTPADQARLVRERALMPAGTSSCAMPKEFVDVAPTAFINLAGYGDEVNVAYPPRPADPKIAWNIDWTVKVRYRTAESALLGMPGAGGAGGPPARGAEQQQQQQTPQAPPTSARDAVMKGLGSAITGGLFGR